jgi:HEAT repeat protein
MRLVGNRNADKTVRESSALALGMLATKDPDICTFLGDVAADQNQERRTRAFAALGLGFNGDIGAIPALMSRARAKEKNRDVPACAILALGLLGDEIVVPDLSRNLGGRADRRMKDDILRAYNGAALALIRSRAALPALLTALSDKDIEVRRQAALSLGAIAKPEDAAVIKKLSSVLQTDKNVAVKAFAAFALGEIGNESSVQILMHAYRFGDGFVPHYCTLALAVIGRKTKDSELRGQLTKFIRGELRRRGSNDMRGVLATAVGIIGDMEAIKDIMKIVNSRSDPTLRAHAVLTVGLLNHRAALPVLREILKERSSPVLMRETALTLGIMGDSEANRILIKLVKEGSSEYIRGSAAISLGRLATPDTAQELVKLLTDEKGKNMTRAFAAVALGLALDRDPVPVLSKLGDHLNHFMVVAALGEALTLL